MSRSMRGVPKALRKAMYRGDVNWPSDVKPIPAPSQPAPPRFSPPRPKPAQSLGAKFMSKLSTSKPKAPPKKHEDE